MTRCIDCATNTTSYIPKLKDANIDIVIRYFGSSAWKCAARAEVKALKAAGIDIAAVYETTADMMLGGYAAGVKGAKAVKSSLTAVEAPANAFVYFACDTDTQDYAAVEAYLDGASSVLGVARVGIYGSYDVCKQALAGGHASKAWQTRAWSHGKLLPSAALYQSENHSTAYGDLGFAYDINLVQAEDVGQWGYVMPTAEPTDATKLWMCVIFAGEGGLAELKAKAAGLNDPFAAHSVPYEAREDVEMWADFIQKAYNRPDVMEQVKLLLIT